MFRWPKPWSKKRGDRRTGSATMGSVGEALLNAVLFLLGAIALVVMITSAYLRLWPASYFFPELYFVETRAIVLEKYLVEWQGEDPTPTNRPELLVQWLNGESEIEARITLADGFSEREAGLGLLDRYQQGESYPAWHDPSRSDSLRMRRPGRLRFGLTLVAMIAAICMGGARVVLTVMSFGTSPERRAALAGKAAKMDLVRDAKNKYLAHEYPYVPGVDDMSNSPGVTLAFRLPIVHSPLLRLLAAACFCLVWICIAAVFVEVVASGLVRGEPEWFLGLVTLIFVGLGVWSFRYFWLQLSFAASVGPSSVEISDHPLYPGNEYRVALTQAGRVDLEQLKLRLVCQEEATFREGTDVRTELRQVHEQEIFAGQDIRLRAGKPFEHVAGFVVEVDVMHSFHGDNNAVQWKVMVDGSASGVNFCRQFPVIVYPRDSQLESDSIAGK